MDIQRLMRVKEILEKEGPGFVVKEVRNRNPFLVLKSILLINSDKNIIKALRNKKRNLFGDLNSEEGEL
ncbi:unnamed protein product [Euphydryas editha]|uniref:Uncharacterized protein n=1 Tax=Euphydryas editha TaxID=104508 RepID=A0AAU9TAM3_EUPED|nr:unnamed protein product [Euphydryas editha]